jgi:hypothetical protein
MHTTRAPQLTLDELIDALEAKIAAMRAEKISSPEPETLWRPRANGRHRPARTHPFSNIEEL